MAEQSRGGALCVVGLAVLAAVLRLRRSYELRVASDGRLRMMLARYSQLATVVAVVAVLAVVAAVPGEPLVHRGQRRRGGRLFSLLLRPALARADNLAGEDCLD